MLCSHVISCDRSSGNASESEGEELVAEGQDSDKGEHSFYSNSTIRCLLLAMPFYLPLVHSCPSLIEVVHYTLQVAGVIAVIETSHQVLKEIIQRSMLLLV